MSKKYPENIKLEVVSEYVLKNKSHRDIQEEILNIPAPLHGGGYEVMNILHEFSLKKEHKNLMSRNPKKFQELFPELYLKLLDKNESKTILNGHITDKQKRELLKLRKEFEKIYDVGDLDSNFKKEFEIFFELYDNYALNGIYFLIRKNKSSIPIKNLSLFLSSQDYYYMQTTFWTYLNKNNKEIAYPEGGNNGKVYPLGFTYFFNENTYRFEIQYEIKGKNKYFFNLFKSLAKNMEIEFKYPLEIKPERNKISATTADYNSFNDLEKHRKSINKYLENKSVLIKPISYKEFVNNLKNKLYNIKNSEIDIIKENNKEKKANLERFFEGNKKQYLHEYKERDPKLIKKAKEEFKQKYKSLFCEVCDFSFEDKYGKEYIEGHHKKPISTLSEKTEMKVKDIALLCANCHRMAHYHTYNKTLTIEELKKILNIKY